MKLLSKMLFAALLGVGVVAGAAAQGYPTRPVQVMIGFPAGGSGDIVARLVMQKMSELTGNPFLVENRTGAGGNLAFSATAAAKPDGYALAVSENGASAAVLVTAEPKAKVRVWLTGPADGDSLTSLEGSPVPAGLVPLTT